MYSVDELIEQVDNASDLDEDEPHLEEAEEAPASENAESKDGEQSTSKKVTKPRKPSNRPKLNVERLKGPNGLPCMEKIFSKIKFMGKDHEREDLNTVMNTLQYWCHRLYPQYNFDDCLAQLERLGTKKPVMTLKKKILFDMLEEDKPIINEEDNPDDELQEAINEFDLLLEDSNPVLSQRPVSISPPARVELTDDQKDMIERNRLLATERRKARLEALEAKQREREENNKSQENSEESSLTDEQKAIIERNRLLAIEKRRAKNLDVSGTSQLSSQVSQDSQDLPENSNEALSQQSNQPPAEVDINELIEEINDAPIINSNSNEMNQPVSEDKQVANKSDVEKSVLSQQSNQPPAEVDINEIIEEINPENNDVPIINSNSNDKNQQILVVEEVTNKSVVEETISQISDTVPENIVADTS